MDWVVKITELVALDIRFPTSRTLDGSDAMNPDPDYSAAYCVLRTDEGLEGHGFTFTIGRGNEVCVAAIEALAPLVRGRDAEGLFDRMGAFWGHVTGDSQLRWIGPEKGVIHLATAAVVNAVWDLYAKREGKPLWKLLVDMTPEQVVSCIDFRYITDALRPEEALEILRANAPTKAEREEEMRRRGFPAYTTSAGWLGYPEEKVRHLAREARDAGWTHFKMKVGRDLEGDVRRARLLREEICPDAHLMMDANQVWDVGEAIERIRVLAEFDPWASCSSNSCRPRRLASAKSTRAGSAALTRCSPSCSWHASSACPSARTPAAWASASTFSISRSSTTSPSAPTSLTG